MKKKIAMCVFGLTLAGFNSVIFASDVCVYSPGRVVCGSGTVDNVSGLGSVSLSGTIVTGTITVSGSLKAENSNINHGSIHGGAVVNNTIVNDFCVNGSIDANNLKATGPFVVNGLLDATESDFNTLKIWSNKTILTDSQTKDIQILQDNNNEKIYLNGSTVVNGNIVFDSGHGEVIENGGTVTGKIIGGKIDK